MRLPFSRGRGTGDRPQAPPVPHRGAPPRPPEPSPALHKRRAEQAAYLREREAREHRSILRGLILLALLVVLVGVLRAGVHRAFYAGWWRQW